MHEKIFCVPVPRKYNYKMIVRICVYLMVAGERACMQTALIKMMYLKEFSKNDYYASHEQKRDEYSDGYSNMYFLKK